jgi:NitT/TauT family transport system substrate-binding protein
MTDDRSGQDNGPSADRLLRKRISRRNVLIGGATAGATAGMSIYSAYALPSAAPAFLLDDRAICRTPVTPIADEGTTRATPKKLKFSWNAAAVCSVTLPVAVEQGFFTKRGLDVELVNFGGSTDQLLEGIATGKADAGIGLALRWLKPLEQGFDVKITAGTHGGCLRLLVPTASGINDLKDLKGKSIAVTDIASPAKNFFSILLAKHGIDPARDVEWRVYPGELLSAAVDKGEAHALADLDPRTYLFLKDGKLKEIATNLQEEYAHRTCCIIGIRGSLVREDRAAARDVTLAVLEAARWTVENPAAAAKTFAQFAPKASVADLETMIRYHTHHHNPTGEALKKELALYTDELKLVSVIKPSTDTAKFAERIYEGVLG